jgi:hypothetical protein
MEAKLKASGDGLAGLRRSSAGTWSGRRLDLGRNYVGAVFAEGIGWQLRCWQW